MKREILEHHVYLKVIMLQSKSFKVLNPEVVHSVLSTSVIQLFQT